MSRPPNISNRMLKLIEYTLIDPLPGEPDDKYEAVVWHVKNAIDKVMGDLGWRDDILLNLPPSGTWDSESAWSYFRQAPLVAYGVCYSWEKPVLSKWGSQVVEFYGAQVVCSTALHDEFSQRPGQILVINNGSKRHCEVID